MNENKTINEEIEDSLRICEEILNGTSGMLPPETKYTPEYTPDEPIPEKKEEPPVATIPLNPVASSFSSTTTPASAQNISAAASHNTGFIANTPVSASQAKDTIGSVRETVTPVKNRTSVPKKTRGKSIAKTLVSILICVAIAVAASILITMFVANHTTVEGGSMEPCLKSEDELIVEKISYLIGEPQRLDVIVFKYNEDTNYIKRIIGLPGESVQIDDEGKIYINDKPIFDEFGNGVIEDAGMAEKKIELGNDEYFVLGDNRNASKDSRDEDVGPVKAEQIVGKAWLRVMPFDDFGMIK